MGTMLTYCRLRLVSGVVQNSAQAVLSAYSEVIGGFVLTFGLALLGLVFMVLISVMLTHRIKTLEYRPLEFKPDKRVYFTLVGFFIALLVCFLALAILGISHVLN